MTDSLEIKSGIEIRLIEFETKTGFPARASLEELEMIGGRYVASKTIGQDGRPNMEYVLLDPNGTEQEVYIWKREKGSDNFLVHLEMETKNKY